jgi:acyl-coenzyme A thioesterase PaaI-like protein
MTQATGARVIAQFLLHSPFVRDLGMRLDSIEADRARLAMPYREELATIGDVAVIRRGKSLCFCDDDVTDADGGLVAKGIVTYKLG